MEMVYLDSYGCFTISKLTKLANEERIWKILMVLKREIKEEYSSYCSFLEGSILMSRKKFKESLRELLRAVKLEQNAFNRSFICHHIGKCFSKLNKYSEACKFYDIDISIKKKLGIVYLYSVFKKSWAIYLWGRFLKTAIPVKYYESIMNDLDELLTFKVKNIFDFDFYADSVFENLSCDLGFLNFVELNSHFNTDSLINLDLSRKNYLCCQFGDERVLILKVFAIRSKFLLSELQQGKNVVQFYEKDCLPFKLIKSVLYGIPDQIRDLVEKSKYKYIPLNLVIDLCDYLQLDELCKNVFFESVFYTYENDIVPFFRNIFDEWEGVRLKSESLRLLFVKLMEFLDGKSSRFQVKVIESISISIKRRKIRDSICKIFDPKYQKSSKITSFYQGRKSLPLEIIFYIGDFIPHEKTIGKDVRHYLLKLIQLERTKNTFIKKLRFLKNLNQGFNQHLYELYKVHQGMKGKMEIKQFKKLISNLFDEINIKKFINVYVKWKSIKKKISTNLMEKYITLIYF